MVRQTPCSDYSTVHDARSIFECTKEQIMSLEHIKRHILRKPTCILAFR